MWSTIAASVVDLPEPVGPVTSTTPRGWSGRSLRKIFGAFSCSSRLRIFDGIVRNHRAGAAVLHEGVDAESALDSGIENEKSHSRFSS